MQTLACIDVMLLAVLLGQGNSASDPIHIGPGVTPPKLLRKQEPKFSPQARADHVQGTVVLELVVDEKGRATEIKVISPLGYGLDEEAEKAVKKWEFAPGMKGGHPVNIIATVEVNFRFTNTDFDEKIERRRTSYNMALHQLSSSTATAASVERAVKTIQDLSGEKFPPAMHLLGRWEANGEHVAKDPAAALDLFQKAASKNYGPALYEIGMRHIEGSELPKDQNKGIEEIRQAAMLGSPQAQFYLGDSYEKGQGVPEDPAEARHYFRLCAARGIGLCQYRLGALMLKSFAASGRDYVQAVAWLQLAQEQGVDDAKTIAVSETAKLTTEQTKWLNSIKRQLVQR